ncbi:Gastrin-releasing peptide receptor [Liparis tanakae]|uniref:Gastrin-releasing peptide receptor n=1 Tax=Liparis tanakae TaxID=230148 RepID=A0A4Z2E039_9TELE|nr:Gastrin-releasing peptide receptor [Liparis tanakae]
MHTSICLSLHLSNLHDQVDTSLVHFVCSVVARFLAFSNSCLNPFALYLLSDTFQKQFNQQLCCCCRMILRRSAQSPTHYNTRATSVRSTHQSVGSRSMINGRRVCQEDCV